MKIYVIALVIIIILFLHHYFIHGVWYDIADIMALASHEFLIILLAAVGLVAHRYRI